MFSALHKTWALLDSYSKRDALYLLLLMAGGAIFEAVGIGMIFQVLLLFSLPDNSGGSSYDFGEEIQESLIIYAKLIYPESPETVFLLSILFFFIIKNVYLAYLLNYQLHFGWSGRAKFASRLYNHYFALSYETSLTRNTATIVRNLVGTVSELYFKLVTPAILLITEILVAASILSILAFISPIFTFTAAALLGSAAGLYYLIIRHKLVYWGKRVLECSETVLLWTNQGFVGFKEAIISGSKNFFQQSFREGIQAQSEYQKKIAFFSQLPRFIVETLLASGVIISILILLPDQGSLEKALPVVGVFAASAFRLLPSVNRITQHVNNIRNGIPSVDIIHQELNLPTETLTSAACSGPIHEFNDCIRLKNISFKYLGSEQLVLADISLEIKKGTIIAFVGASGAGKTTLADILLGLLQPSSGCIELDGKSISTEEWRWRSLFGYVPQEIFLIDDTLRKNVEFGRDEAEDGWSLRRALELSQYSAQIEMFPAGIDTVVGERGSRLSGGQRQRVGISRAIFNDPKVLVFDEATSALDSNAEFDLINAIEKLRKQMTVIIIAHRLSSVRSCDEIYFMDKGRIVDHGSFSELANRNAKFQKLIKNAGLSNSQNYDSSGLD